MKTYIVEFKMDYDSDDDETRLVKVEAWDVTKIADSVYKAAGDYAGVTVVAVYGAL